MPDSGCVSDPLDVPAPTSQCHAARTTLCRTSPDGPRDAQLGALSFLARIYEVLPLPCPACGGPMTILAFITDPPVVTLPRLPNTDRKRLGRFSGCVMGFCLRLPARYRMLSIPWAVGAHSRISA